MIHDYKSLKALAKELDRSVETLIAQSPNNDPFYLQPKRRAKAEWFAQVWQDLGITSRTHLRAIHYRLVSQASRYLDPDGRPYLNTVECCTELNRASQYARYLGLVPVGLIDDRRNDKPVRWLSNYGEPGATLEVKEPTAFTPFQARLSSYLPPPPEYLFEPSSNINQRYHVELWCEKSTMNAILLDLAQQYRLNVIAGAGEISVTHCYQLVQRAVASGRPVRILYITDFDPAGVSIPAAASRKIEFFIRRDHSDLDLDIQVRQIALTHDQCVEYALPRTPIKETEARAERFEDRFGEGATELDALEALHPGALRDIIRNEVVRYYDIDLQERADQAVGDFRAEVEATHTEVIRRHRGEREAIRAEHRELIERCNAALEPFREPLRQVEQRFQALQATIAEELADEAPDPADIEWPEPEEGDEDNDPLYDSRREYLEQIERYRAHQGKQGTERVPQWVNDRQAARLKRARHAAKANGKQP
jgi:hypothetical protein